MTTGAHGPQAIEDSEGIVLNDAPATKVLAEDVLAFLRWLRNEGLRPHVDWLHGKRTNRWRVTFGTSLPTRTFGEVFVHSRTGTAVFGRLVVGQRDPGVTYKDLPAMRSAVHRRLVETNRETYLETSRYTTIDDRGVHSHVNTTSYPEALAHARAAGHQVVELVYAYVKARPVVPTPRPRQRLGAD